ncbi:MAG: class IV adenylate cyclase [Bryobacteraceae bacterium]|nr:class IV adenylate cyclase [Bryobacteraceae bacterium]
MPGTNGPLEVEIKLAIASAAEGLGRLERAGFAQLHERAFEANSVFDTESLELIHSGRLLRLREFRGEALLTYKGPAEPGPHKTRREIETRVEDAGATQALLEALGYRVVFRYEKYRTEFARPGDAGHACLDETPIGCFLELEGAPEWIDATAAELGFRREDYITLSYGALYREHCRRAGIEPAHMVFAQGGNAA